MEGDHRVFGHCTVLRWLKVEQLRGQLVDLGVLVLDDGQVKHRKDCSVAVGQDFEVWEFGIDLRRSA